MKIYIPNTSKQSIGGGWTFITNLKKALNTKAHFVDRWGDCDIYFIVGATITSPSEVRLARKAGKKILFRVDNVPKKSRNKRCTPHERMKELSELCDVVVYQSEWAKDYCKPLTGDGAVVYNGVDTDIFKPDKDIGADHRYLFAFHGKSEMKGFWTAHAYFQNVFREDVYAEFWFINDFGRDLPELKASNFDFWNGEKFLHLNILDTPEKMAEIMDMCTHLIFPSIFDAAPNTVLEAMACGLDIVGYPDSTMSGTSEIVEQGIVSLEDMGEEYYGIMKLLINDQSNVQ